jgi:hypothetical protein
MRKERVARRRALVTTLLACLAGAFVLAVSGRAGFASRRGSIARPAPPDVARSAPDAGAPSTLGGAPCPEYSYERGLARGRELAAAKRYGEAARAFDEAVRARPYDARARAERAHARLLGAPAGASEVARAGYARNVVAELQLARALAVDAGLLATIAYDEALAHERAGAAAEARYALVRAERLGSKAATRKLGGASRCTVTVPVERGSDRSFVATWSDVLAEVASGSLCEAPPFASEDEARAYACGGCQNPTEGWRKGDCEGASPWRVTTGRMHCSNVNAIIQDVGGGRYFAAARHGEAPSELGREGKLWVERTQTGAWSWVKGHFYDAESGAPLAAVYREGEGWTDESFASGSPRTCLADERAAVGLERSRGCQSSTGAGLVTGEVRAYYDREGRWLASLELRGDDASRVRVRAEPTRLVVEGAGCNLSVPFARPPGPP